MTKNKLAICKFFHSNANKDARGIFIPKNKAPFIGSSIYIFICIFCGDLILTIFMFSYTILGFTILTGVIILILFVFKKPDRYYFSDAEIADMVIKYSNKKKTK